MNLSNHVVLEKIYYLWDGCWHPKSGIRWWIIYGLRIRRRWRLWRR